MSHFLFGSQPHNLHPHNAAYQHHHILYDIDHHRIFSEWSSLDLAWTSAFSLIVVTSVVGNVMVGSISCSMVVIVVIIVIVVAVVFVMVFVVVVITVIFNQQVLWTVFVHRRMWSITN